MYTMGAVFGCKSGRHTNYTHYDHQVANWERGVDVDDEVLTVPPEKNYSQPKYKQPKILYARCHHLSP